MKYLLFFSNQAQAVGYVSQPLNSVPVEFPHFPELVSIERIVFILLIMILAYPLLKPQKNLAKEKERINLIRLVSLVGGVALIIRFYRIISGT